MPKRLALGRRALAVASCAGLAACSAVETTSAERFTADGELIALSGGDAGAANACFACHGLDGRGNGAGAPRLAGLDQGYLDRQLQAYADGRRRHPQMSWIAKRLEPGQRHLVSAYYSRMPYQAADLALPPPPPLWLEGDAQRGIPACADCHGRLGEGVGPANPALAGQPAAYLVEQVEKWRRSERRNDPDNVMLRISRLLSLAEAEALSAYAARLPGGPPRPESPAAFREARRGDPRNDASAPPPRAPE